MNWATFPLPETRHVLPPRTSSLVASISRAKYTTPYPVASWRICEPPHLIPLPVMAPTNRLAMRLYWPKR